MYVGPGMAGALSPRQVKALISTAEKDLRTQPLATALWVRLSLPVFKKSRTGDRTSRDNPLPAGPGSTRHVT